MSQNDALNPNQKRALVALLVHPSVRKAAAAIHLNERTLWRYLADPTFKAELSSRQGLAIAAATAALAGLLTNATETWLSLLQDGDTSASVKARIAAGIVDAAVKLSSFSDVEQRVSDLENRTEGEYTR